MAQETDAEAIWLPVIGNALAYLCLEKFSEKNPDKVDSVLKKVRFLESLGVPAKDAANAAGSNPKSVQVLKSQGAKRAIRK